MRVILRPKKFQFDFQLVNLDFLHLQGLLIVLFLQLVITDNDVIQKEIQYTNDICYYIIGNLIPQK